MMLLANVIVASKWQFAALKFMLWQLLAGKVLPAFSLQLSKYYLMYDKIFINPLQQLSTLNDLSSLEL